MTEPQTVELWPCGYTAKCSAPHWASTILRYLDSQGDPKVRPALATPTRASSALS